VTGPRLEPQDPADWSESTRKLLGPPGRNQVPQILPLIAHSPALLGPFLGWSASLALEGTLAAADAEILALRVAYLCRSEFEWGHHVDYALSAGLTKVDIARVAAGAGEAGWEPHQRSLIVAVDELLDDHRVAAATWEELEDHFDEAQLVEIPLVVGQYAMLSMLANSAGLAATDGQAPLP
jgi:4-carboxymuconolactone decarboxylase